MGKLKIAIVLTGAAICSTFGFKYILDSKKYDSEGYNKKGYDRDGYNRSGYNKQGYDKQGYNIKGKNRDAKTKDDLNMKMEDYLRRYEEAQEAYKKNDYVSACRNCRKIVPSILKNISKHYGWLYSDEHRSFNDLIEINSKIYDKEMKRKLHELRKYGNIAEHDDEDEIEIKENECYFVIKLTGEMIELFKTKLYLP